MEATAGNSLEPHVIVLQRDDSIRYADSVCSDHLGGSKRCRRNSSTRRSIHSRSPSMRDGSCSRSPSVRDKSLLLSQRRSSSLEELHRLTRSGSSCRRPRCNSQDSSGCKRKGSVSTRSSRKNSATSTAQVRRTSTTRSRTSGRETGQYMPPELKSYIEAKERRRQRIVVVIVATFIFLVVCSILAVVVTLTHRSEHYVGNRTTLYYTFSKPSDVIAAEGKRTKVRKENEELMNSLQREPSVVAPPPAPPPSHRQDMTIAP